MRPLLALAVLGAALAAAGSAAAQQQPFLQEAMARQARMATPWRMPDAYRAEFETLLDESSGNNIAAQPLERVDLANRVSGLIQLGRCQEARDLANAEGDRVMALRARQICRSRRS